MTVPTTLRSFDCPWRLLLFFLPLDDLLSLEVEDQSSSESLVHESNRALRDAPCGFLTSDGNRVEVLATAVETLASFTSAP